MVGLQRTADQLEPHKMANHRGLVGLAVMKVEVRLYFGAIQGAQGTETGFLMDSCTTQTTILRQNCKIFPVGSIILQFPPPFVPGILMLLLVMMMMDV